MTTTMRERFKNSWGDFLADEALIQIGDFIEQELKKEREEIVEMIERNKENNPLGERAINRNEALDNIINTIKNRV